VSKIDWSNSLVRIEGNFKDKNNNTCLIQEGLISNSNPSLRLGVLYDSEGNDNTPMKLTRQMILDLNLIELLQYFVDNECLPITVESEVY
jgi:hypothetical protein